MTEGIVVVEGREHPADLARRRRWPGCRWPDHTTDTGPAPGPAEGPETESVLTCEPATSTDPPTERVTVPSSIGWATTPTRSPSWPTSCPRRSSSSDVDAPGDLRGADGVVELADVGR